jgi:arsenite/tail-anchored protein-transporting ATPase
MDANRDRIAEGDGFKMSASPSFRDFLDHATQFLFFTGKGGVGKTSLACATALALSERGRRVLLISTDPASNLDEVLDAELDGQAREIAGMQNLFALNIDPEAAAAVYREKIVGPLRGLLPPAALQSMEEQLSGACTVEIAAFDEFARFLGDEAGATGYDHVIFDTAPTGHTLRLMSLSKAWTGFFETNTSGNSCLGPLAGLEKQRSVYQSSVEALADPRRTTVVLVSRPLRAPLKEARRSRDELAAIGIQNHIVVLNGVYEPADAADEIARRLGLRTERALGEFADFLHELPVYRVPLRAHNLIGAEPLRAVFNPFDENTEAGAPAAWLNVPGELDDLSAVADRLEAAGHGVILTMGKGGVGKTTVAAALALELARRGHRVKLSTTDPAAHVADALKEEKHRLTISRIDPAKETRAYVEQVLSEQGRNMDAASRALLEEDLRSPCTEEIAVFRAFARTVAEGEDGFVVLDTAPTGHTLLLLDATEAYHRELGRQSRDTAPEEVKRLLPRLRDPDFTRVLLVTLPEATPVHEAQALQADLRRAGIEAFAWIINQSLAASGTRDPLLRLRAENELPYIREVLAANEGRAVLLPWTREEPAGAAGLAQFFPAHATS